MTRKILSIFVFIVTLSITFLPLRAAAISITDLLPPQQSFIGREEGPEPGKGIQLPKGSFLEELVPAIITIVLSIAGSVALITFVVTGIMMIVAHGNEELYTKAKTIFLYALGGLVIIALSYAVIYGIFTIRFGDIIGEG